MIAALFAFGFGFFKLKHVEHVGQTGGHDWAIDAKVVLTHVAERNTGIGVERPVTREVLADVCHEVGIYLLVVGFAHTIRAIERTSCEQSVGGGVVFALVGVGAAVDAGTACEAQPIEHLIAHATVEHKAVFLVFAQVAISNPIRVLTGICFETLWPILSADATRSVVAFIHHHVVPVVAAREQVGSNQWVAVLTLVHHVAVGLANVITAHVDGEFVVHRLCGVAESEVVTVIIVVRHHALRVDYRCRSIGLIFSTTG